MERDKKIFVSSMVIVALLIVVGTAVFKWGLEEQARHEAWLKETAYEWKKTNQIWDIYQVFINQSNVIVIFYNSTMWDYQDWPRHNSNPDIILTVEVGNETNWWTYELRYVYNHLNNGQDVKIRTEWAIII